MIDDGLSTEERLQAWYEDQVAALKEDYAAAETRRDRSRVRRRWRRLRRRAFNKQVKLL